MNQRRKNGYKKIDMMMIRYKSYK